MEDNVDITGKVNSDLTMNDNTDTTVNDNTDITMTDNTYITTGDNMEVVENICRLCLKFDGVMFLPLDASCNEKIKLVLPELNVVGSDLMICDKCNSLLDDSFKLKQTLCQSDMLVTTKKEVLKIVGKVNLGYILNGVKESKSICRVCLNSDEGNYTSLNEATEGITFTKILETCVPELDTTVVANPLVCETCCQTLFDMYTFKTTCLSIEEKIKKYCESDPATINLNMNNILSVLRNTEKFEGDNDFLSAFEIKDEEEGDIFDSISNTPSKHGNIGESDYEVNRKRASEGPSGNNVPKKKAKVTLTPKSDNLPNFKFNSELLFNVRPGVSLSEWLALVDKQKSEHGWSDYTTIQKVLLRLKEMPDIYTWFSSIGEIMNWDEWKKKLIQAFPDKDDYCLSLKKVLTRKKREGETFVDYYHEKVKLMKSKGITGENAVSCLFGGIPFSNILIGCIGRIGNYKTPEDVLDYFKSCDDKQKVMGDDNKKPGGQVAAKANEKPVPKSSGKPAPKPVGKQVVKSNTVVRKENKRIIKGKCYKCNERGHAAFECRRNPTEPLKPFSGPKPNQTNIKSAPKKTKKRCTYCNNFGHRLKLCPFLKIDKYKRQQALNRVNQTVFAGLLQCSYCNKPNHTSVNCPEMKNKAPQSQNQRPQAKNETSHRRSPEPRCAQCGKFGHTIYDCHETRNKVSQSDASRRYPPESVEHESHRQDKDAYKGPTCHYCGNFGHKPNTCRHARRAGEESYFNDSTHSQTSQNQFYKQLLCFKCYKIGHEATDCPRYPQRSYRK